MPNKRNDYIEPTWSVIGCVQNMSSLLCNNDLDELSKYWTICVGWFKTKVKKCMPEIDFS